MLHVAQFRLLGLGTAPQQRRAPQIKENPNLVDRSHIQRVAKELSDLRNARSKSQQFTAAHSTECKIAVIALASRRAIQEPSASKFISKHRHSTVTALCNLPWSLLGSDYSLATRLKYTHIQRAENGG